MTKEEIAQAAYEWVNGAGRNVPSHYSTQPAFIAGVKWANERLESELLGNPEQLKAERDLPIEKVPKTFCTCENPFFHDQQCPCAND